MYNNPYMSNYNSNFGQQTLNERIDGQIAQLNQMKEQLKNNQQPAINQTFQLAPTHQSNMKYANTIDDVNKEMVFGDTAFFSADMSIVWIKNSKGDIKTYELDEIVPVDEKDMQIQYLQSQIEELKGMIKNDANVTNVITEQTTTNPPINDKPTREEPKNEKPTSVSKISRSKKE